VGSPEPQVGTGVWHRIVNQWSVNGTVVREPWNCTGSGGVNHPCAGVVVACVCTVSGHPRSVCAGVGPVHCTGRQCGGVVCAAGRGTNGGVMVLYRAVNYPWQVGRKEGRYGGGR